MANILVIDDNPEILDANVSYLTEQGFAVIAADTGVKAVSFLNEKQFDCIVLDVLLPDLDGFAICKAARTVTGAPIIFLTCMDDLDDKIQGLMSGGDDYMTKPYSLKELTARIHALLRRGEKSAERRDADFYIDRQNKMIHTPDKNVFLSQKELDLFLLFYENPGKVFSKDDLFKKLWPESADIGTVAVHILKLRRKLEYAKPYIGTIANDYRTGYHMDLPERPGSI